MAVDEESSKSTLQIPFDIQKYADEHNRSSEDTELNTTKRKTKLIVLILFNLIIISILLIIRFAHPSKPQFIIQDATVFNFNLSSPSSSPPPLNLLSSTLQITISSQNPNDNSGIYYDDLGIYAEYKNQQITYQTDISRGVYQGHKGSNVWSLFINGTNVPIAPYNVPFLKQDQLNGIINLTIKLDGHVHWKIGELNTRKYHIHVLCSAMMDFGQGKFGTNDVNGVFVFASVKYLLYRRCSVTV
ncbi:NDR1/HIN1-like protein 1 [Impatiens glandulifera]|uniref:NDR1/HIN1-like protein 1 n=1 Tax=Impatiens glandulifera TaxID=253017 RepID=UPI001FB09FC7|nr:NDR1/HIN1-like protein 1 [Impatiens glandulifera]